MYSLVRVSSLAVVLGLGGCGGCNDSNGVGHLPDAASPDAMPPDAVSLVVINQGVPVGGVPVYFLNADGSVASATVTDGTGTASAEVTAGGSVTALRPFTTQMPAAAPGGDELRTFLGVKPGDHLVLSRAATDVVNVTFDAAAPDGGDAGTTFQLVTTCGGGVKTISPDGTTSVELDSCHGAADLAVVASGGGLDTPQSLYHASATLPLGELVPVSLRDDAYTNASDVTFSYANAPPDAQITVLHSPGLPHGYLGPYVATVDAGTSDVTISEAAVPAAIEVVDSSLTFDNNAHHVVDWGPYSTTYATDLSPSDVLLREGIDGPTFDIPTAKLTWTEAAAGATPDTTVAAIQVARGEATWHWEIAAPYSAAGIAFPHLPADAAMWIPTTGDTVTVDPLTNVKVSGGYNAVRGHIFDIRDDLGPTGFAIGNGGRAVIVQFPAPPPPPPPGVRSQR
jgi:hypothetical protein